MYDTLLPSPPSPPPPMRIKPNRQENNIFVSQRDIPRVVLQARPKTVPETIFFRAWVGCYWARSFFLPRTCRQRDSFAPWVNFLSLVWPSPSSKPHSWNGELAVLSQTFRTMFASFFFVATVTTLTIHFESFRSVRAGSVFRRIMCFVV